MGWAATRQAKSPAYSRVLTQNADRRSFRSDRPRPQQSSPASPPVRRQPPAGMTVTVHEFASSRRGKRGSVKPLLAPLLHSANSATLTDGGAFSRENSHPGVAEYEAALSNALALCAQGPGLRS